MKFPESKKAHSLLDGLTGLEVGGSSHNPFGLKTRNVDVTDSLDTVFKRSEIDLCGEALPVDIVAPGDAIPVPDESESFVISSHCLEHIWSTLSALKEWARIIKPGGFIFTIVPTRTADAQDVGRDVTTMAELLARHEGTSKPDPNDTRHCAVFDVALIAEICEWAKRELDCSLIGEITPDDKLTPPNGWMFVLRKAGDAVKTQAERGALSMSDCLGFTAMNPRQKYMTAFGFGKALMVDPIADFEAYKMALGIKRNADAVKTLALCGDMGTACFRFNPPFCELAKDPRLDIRATNDAKPENLDWADVIWLQRTVANTNPPLFEKMANARAHGKRIVFDNDDWLHCLPAENPVTQAVLDQGQITNIERMLNVCDVAAFSTEYLEKLYAPMVRSGRTVVLHNCVDVEAWDVYEKRPFGKSDDSVLIGWSGSPTHYADLQVIVPAIAELMRKYPNVWFVRCGAAGADAQRVEFVDRQGQKRSGFVPGDAIAALPANRRLVFEFEPYSNTIGKYISLFDIGIAPLTFCQFNRGKSRAKILEYSLCGVPSIATDIEPYNRDTENDPTILVKDNDPYEWFRQLERLVLDRGLREDLGRRSREYVLANYSIKDQVSKWADVILGLAAEAKCATITNKKAVA